MGLVTAYISDIHEPYLLQKRGQVPTKTVSSPYKNGVKSLQKRGQTGHLLLQKRGQSPTLAIICRT